MPSLKSIAKKTGIWKWLALGAGLTAGIVGFAYNSHKNFEEIIVNNFNSQQAVFISSLQTIVLDHIDEAKQNLEHIAIKVKSDTSKGPEILSTIYNVHKDVFLSISLVDEQERLLFRAPDAGADSTIIGNKPIQKYKEGAEVFLSERYISNQGQIITNLFVSFTLPGEQDKKYFVMGSLRIEEYMKTHLSLWAGGDICFMMSDDDGDVFSLLNVYCEDPEMMKRVNLFSLDDACLSCHEQDEFSDVLQARQKGTVHAVYKYPDGRTTNRTSLSFPIYNERWTMSICSPFEHIQGAIDENANENLLYSLLSLLVVGSFAYVTYRTRKKGALLEAEADNLRTIAETTEALRESEKKYRTLFDDSRDAIVIVTWEGKFADVNQSALDLFGYTKKEEMTGQEVLMIYANPDDRPMFLQEIEQKDFVRDYLTKYRKKDGAEIDCLFTSTAWRAKDGKILGTQGIIRDITELKQAEEALRESEEKFRRLFEQSNDAVFIHNFEGQILDVNHRACEMLDYDKKHLLNLLIPSLHPEDELAKSKGATRFETRFKKKDGTEIFVDISSRIVDEDKGIIQGIVRDITERKKTEEALKESEKKYRVLLESSSEPWVLSDAKTFRYVDANQAALDLYGYTKEEFLELTPFDISAQPGKSRNNLEKIISGKSTIVEIRQKKKDGTIIPTEIYSSYFKVGDKEYIIGQVRDISERKEREVILKKISTGTLSELTALQKQRYRK